MLTRTRTHTPPETTPSEKTVKENTLSPELVERTVDERGFFLYEWISRQELRMTLERDYLQIIRWASIPLAIISAIAAFIGFAGGPIGSMIAVFGILFFFYLIVFCWLFAIFLYRSYLYTRGADVIITDNHYVAGGNIIPKSDIGKIKGIFSSYESHFDERFLENSKLAERKSHAQKALMENLKTIAFGGGKILQGVGRSRDSGGIVIAIVIAGFLYSAMMALVYFVGIFFISLFGRLFSLLAHISLKASNNIEYKIQDLFSLIDDKSNRLANSKSTVIDLLDEAKQNEWKDGLLTKLNESLELIATLSSQSVDNTAELRRTLEDSKYKDIFNFVKYGSWVKKQILEPIESILSLLQKNKSIITSTIDSLQSQILLTDSPSLKNPLILQQKRLEVQLENFDRTIQMLESYKEKLTTK